VKAPVRVNKNIIRRREGLYNAWHFYFGCNFIKRPVQRSQFHRHRHQSVCRTE